MSGTLTNSYTNSPPVTILGYAKTLIILRNMGGGSGATYQVQANPKTNDSLAPWVTIKSGTAFYSGNVVTHKLTDAWEAIRVQGMNTQSGFNSNIVVWVNVDPR